MRGRTRVATHGTTIMRSAGLPPTIIVSTLSVVVRVAVRDGSHIGLVRQTDGTYAWHSGEVYDGFQNSQNAWTTTSDDAKTIPIASVRNPYNSDYLDADGQRTEDAPSFLMGMANLEPNSNNYILELPGSVTQAQMESALSQFKSTWVK